MKSSGLKTKIFLDSGDTNETKQAINLLGFLNGQTTNPTLIAKNPQAQIRLEMGNKFTKDEIFTFYQSVVKEISAFIPKGSVSVEVYADTQTRADEMVAQGKGMFSWIPNAHIKLPITTAGLEAANRLTKEGIKVNMTLCFSQEQAAAVYAATRGAKKGDVFVSPFIGRLDDKGENGMDLIKNILQMYRTGESHVEVLTASVRNLNHHIAAIQAGSDIITSPFKVLCQWSEKGLPLGENFTYEPVNLKPIPYREIDLEKNWENYDIHHELTDLGIEKFCRDWNNLIKPA